MSTYSENLKKELVGVNINNSLEAMSELCGIVKSAGEISLNYKKEKIIILTEFKYLYERVEKLLNVYKVDDHDDDDIYIPPSEIKNFFDYDEKGQPSSYVVKTTSLDEKFDINSFSGNNPDFQKKFDAWLYGIDTDAETQMKGVDPIVKLDDAFFDGVDDYGGLITSTASWRSEHLVNKKDVKDLYNYYQNAKSNNETVYILRFAVRDYYAAGCDIWANKGWTESITTDNSDGEYCQGTAFNDFYIISLTYRKGTEEFIIRVDDEPQDINGGLTPGEDDVFEDFSEGVGEVIGGIVDGVVDGVGDFFGGVGSGVKDAFDAAKSVFITIAIILAVIVVVIIILLLSKLIKPLIERAKETKSNKDKVNSSSKTKQRKDDKK